MTAADPIHLTLERFHANLRGELEGGYDALLHPDVVFYSPVVFTPQQGREITKLYLSAAGSTLPGDAPASGESEHRRRTGYVVHVYEDDRKRPPGHARVRDDDGRQIRQRRRHIDVRRWLTRD